MSCIERACVWQLAHAALMATARLSGVMTWASVTIRMTWNATAPVEQSWQLASAYARLRLSTVSPSANTRENFATVRNEPSCVFTATA